MAHSLGEGEAHFRGAQPMTPCIVTCSHPSEDFDLEAALLNGACMDRDEDGRSLGDACSDREEAEDGRDLPNSEPTQKFQFFVASPEGAPAGDGDAEEVAVPIDPSLQFALDAAKCADQRSARRAIAEHVNPGEPLVSSELAYSQRLISSVLSTLPGALPASGLYHRSNLALPFGERSRHGSARAALRGCQRGCRALEAQLFGTARN